ncbi:MAG: hypothetical protein M1817_006223 [Caeruleum heppii]|nr:MAG: hypothetical protein M1817_006223 [Caeruleum heppii]
MADHIPASTGTSKSYNGNCHCGAIKYTVALSPPLEEQKVMSCNCSICIRNGYLMVYPPKESVTFHQGKDKTTVGASLAPIIFRTPFVDGFLMQKYSFGGGNVEHNFCSTCGTSVFIEPLKGGWIDGKYAINVRTFKDVDVPSLTLMYNHKGKTMGKPYEV